MAEKRVYRILVRDLLLKCSIGVHEHERLAPQRVRINVDMMVTQWETAADDIADVVSYEDVINGIKAVLAAGHINLVETLSERIADLCLADARVLSARVRVEKLDVYAEAASVGVEIERSR